MATTMSKGKGQGLGGTGQDGNGEQAFDALTKIMDTGVLRTACAAGVALFRALPGNLEACRRPAA